jgi:hypothetical protein
MNGLERLDIQLIPDWILERWILVAYLIINWRVKDLAERVQIAPERKFYSVVAKYMKSYLKDGVMPPEDIAPAILNIADDYMAGNSLNVRAGDYISIQNHIRGMR